MRRTGPVWRRPLQVGIAVLVVLTAMVILPAPRDALAAYAEQVLYRFCSQTNCVDGKNPAAALIMDGGGNLYGTTVSGGANNGGAVFKLTPIATGWTYNVLYSFCSKALCADGGTPHAGLIMDGTGNLYGTTTGGGPNQSTSGLVFKLVPSGNGWTETVLYSFCTQSNCTDGAQPYGTLIMDAAGNLYARPLRGATGIPRAAPMAAARCSSCRLRSAVGPKRSSIAFVRRAIAPMAFSRWLAWPWTGWETSMARLFRAAVLPASFSNSCPAAAVGRRSFFTLSGLAPVTVILPKPI